MHFKDVNVVFRKVILVQKFIHAFGGQVHIPVVIRNFIRNQGIILDIGVYFFRDKVQPAAGGKRQQRLFVFLDHVDDIAVEFYEIAPVFV